MPEPNTTNIALIIPNTGDLVGSWGSTALNPDFVALDGILGGTTTISLTTPATTVLTLPTGTISAGAGPVQSQNACIFLTGTISGNQIIQLGMPGRYIFHNRCLPLGFYVQVISAGGGAKIGLPPGKKCTVFHDGTNVDFVDQQDTGTAYDLHGATGLPAWMTACTTLPYLIKDGTVYNISAYPTLGNTLGSTFGGDGVNTFGVPDERARMRIAYDPGATGRMTSPVNASTMGSNGGEQSHLLVTGEMPTHTHTLTDPGHVHGPGNASPGAKYLYDSATGVNLTGNSGGMGDSANTGSATTGITIANTGGGGAHNNVQPSIISFLALIKT